MKITFLAMTLFISTVIAGCASTPKFELEGQENFNPQEIAGNWACVFEMTNESNGNKMVSSATLQEYFSEDGVHILSGIMDFQMNDSELGSLVVYMEGSWIANESELMTQGTRVKILATPGSHTVIMKMENSPKMSKAMKNAGKETYVLTDGNWLRTDVKTGNEASCLTWDKWQQECLKNDTGDCGALLDREKQEEARRRFFPDV